MICVAHGTAVRRARERIAETYPGTWYIGSGDLPPAPTACGRRWISPTSYGTTSPRCATASNAPAARPTHLATVAELLPARQRRTLERRRILTEAMA